jgi:hypothetical protein
MMDTYIANIIEEYIYSTVKEYYPEKEGGSIKCEYRTKYGEKNGEYNVGKAIDLSKRKESYNHN